MYRQYEDPIYLEKMLAETQAEYEKVKAENPEDDYLIDLYQDIMELKERVNFAWQDDEYEENCRLWDTY